ncbi:hypothetical protein [Streptomyces shenzhenensis]|uniref:hypothetical protein n=1 Tax=Streptomyces shenzhenensis TaxID=943815 RepID=UPI001F370D20|nr:hypothetical protein [Streptomyces shenzhenensis]
MGIESDQVVYEYLSRVGDIAHQRQLSSAERMRLVSGLRNEIDRHRAKSTVDSPAAVRRILDRLGTPDAVVEAAGGTAGSASEPPPSAVPVQRDAGPAVPAESLRRVVPRPRPAEPDGSSGPPPDWWRVDRSPFGDGDGDEVPGFVGGVEIPELLSRPRLRKAEPADEPGGAGGAAEAVAPVVAEPAPSGRRRIRVVPRPATGWSNPLLLLAAGALVVGAVLGYWFALVLGWAIAYGSRRLTPTETKLAVMWVPGMSVAAGLVWLWGRSAGRWGTPIAQGQMSGAVGETWPWVVRGAAVASALYLVWRSQRTR